MQVFFSPEPIGLTHDAVLARMQQHSPPIVWYRERIVLHHQITPEAVEYFIDQVRRMREEREAEGPVVNKEAEKTLEEDFKSEGKLRRKAMLGY